MNEIQEEALDTRTDTSAAFGEIRQLMEDAATKHIKDLNELILEQKESKTRVKRAHIQKKINKKKETIISYMNEISRMPESTDTEI